MPTGNSVAVVGYSQSAIISSLEMRESCEPHAQPTPADGRSTGFRTCWADPMNPNGGLCPLRSHRGLPRSDASESGPGFLRRDARRTRSTRPAFTRSNTTGTPTSRGTRSTCWRTSTPLSGSTPYTAPIPTINPSNLPPATSLCYSGVDGYTPPRVVWRRRRHQHQLLHDHPNQNLPLLDPLRAIPVVGTPLADLLQPVLTPLVNLGYGDPGVWLFDVAGQCAHPVRAVPAC